MTYLQQHARSIAEPAAFWAEQARSLAWYQAPANICLLYTSRIGS